MSKFGDYSDGAPAQAGDEVVAKRSATGTLRLALSAIRTYVLNALSHTSLADIGTNTHAQVDAHIAAAHVYTVQIWSPAHNPVDGQTVYFGTGAPATTTADVFAVAIPVSGTIIAAYLEVGVGGTLGSGENTTVSVRHNNTTDLQISAAVTETAARQQFSVTGLTQAVSAGDRIQVKVAHPTFVTNPTNVIYSCVVVIRP